MTTTDKIFNIYLSPRKWCIGCVAMKWSSKTSGTRCSTHARPCVAPQVYSLKVEEEEEPWSTACLQFTDVFCQSTNWPIQLEAFSLLLKFKNSFKTPLHSIVIPTTIEVHTTPHKKVCVHTSRAYVTWRHLKHMNVASHCCWLFPLCFFKTYIT